MLNKGIDLLPSVDGVGWWACKLPLCSIHKRKWKENQPDCIRLYSIHLESVAILQKSSHMTKWILMWQPTKLWILDHLNHCRLDFKVVCYYCEPYNWCLVTLHIKIHKISYSSLAILSILWILRSLLRWRRISFIIPSVHFIWLLLPPLSNRLLKFQIKWINKSSCLLALRVVCIH